MYYIGLMSGTSMDAVDAVLVNFAASPLQIAATHSEPLPPQLKENLLALCNPGSNEIDRLGELDIQVGLLFAQACQNLLQKTPIKTSEIIAIGSHGQTVRHRPNVNYPFTLQIGDPNIIASRTKITTIADFRRRDMAQGGQGAPLVPAFHHAIFHNPKKNRVIANIGGIANITVLLADKNKAIMGFDTGPGNVLLDDWIRAHLNIAFDENGAWSSTGICNENLLQELLNDPYLQKLPPKSTGREYFNLAWLETKLIGKNIAPRDVQATLVFFTIHSLLNAITHHFPATDEIFICGGGAHNQYLMEQLKKQSPYSVDSTAVLGADPDWIEALAFAWLAKQTLEKKVGNIPSVTGAKEAVILGGIYPV